MGIVSLRISVVVVANQPSAVSTKLNDGGVLLDLKRACLALLLAPAFLTAACSLSSGFGFPVAEGDIEAGRQAFIDHRCQQCHGVSGVTLPNLAGASGILLVLGGETATVKSYAGLMTSIINPDHDISDAYREQLRLDAEIPLESPMPMRHIDNMTVRQLINIVAFLDSRYVLIGDYAR